MPKDATKGFVASLADGPAFVVVDAVSGAVKKLRASVLTAAFAPASHVGAGGSAHALATSGAAGFMSAADKTKLDGYTDSNTAAYNWAPVAATGLSVISQRVLSWLRVGDIVSVTGMFQMQLSSAGTAGPVSFVLSGNLATLVGRTTVTDLYGVVTSDHSAWVGGRIYEDPANFATLAGNISTNDRAPWLAYHFQYRAV